MEILKSDAAHKYLGRKIFRNLTRRGRIGYQHRVQLAWAKFNHFRSVLTNKHVSIRLRFRLFNALVRPTILFGLATLRMTQTQVVRMDALQRRMLKSIVGWVTVEGEDWRLTMCRMRGRIKAILLCQPVESWSKQLSKKQHGFATKIVKDKG